MRNHPLPIDISVAISNLSTLQTRIHWPDWSKTGRFWSVDTWLQATKCFNDYFCENTFEKLPITKLIDTAYRNGPIVVIDDDDEFDPRETTV